MTTTEALKIAAIIGRAQNTAISPLPNCRPSDGISVGALIAEDIIEMLLDQRSRFDVARFRKTVEDAGGFAPDVTQP